MTNNIFVIEVDIFSSEKPSRSAEVRLQEAVSLTKAINLNIVGSKIIKIRHTKPATLIAQGNIVSLRQLISDAQSDVVLIDCSLSPIQQRNLEKEWQIKVIDRTALILEIFGERARTTATALRSL